MITPDQHIADIVTRDYRTAGVFREYGIDFCCGGKVSLSSVCKKLGVDTTELTDKLTKLYETPSSGENYSDWSAGRLMDFIVGYHHSYIREAIPRIHAYATKVASRHGQTQPELIEVLKTFEHLSKELTDHADDEESRVFPAIRQLISGQANLGDDLQPMILELEDEHEEAGAAMLEIRKLTRDFNPPDWACNTYRILFKELEAFEKDLHQHVHLENNILFDKTRQAWRGLYA